MAQLADALLLESKCSQFDSERNYHLYLTGDNMFGFLESVSNLTSNVLDVALAPVQMTVDLATAATQPLADAAKELVSDVKSLTK